MIEPELASEFFSLGVKEWVLWILKKGSCSSVRFWWTERAVTVYWKQWGLRNEEVFNGVGVEKMQQLKQVYKPLEEDEAFYQAETLNGQDLRRNAPQGLNSVDL